MSEQFDEQAWQDRLDRLGVDVGPMRLPAAGECLPAGQPDLVAAELQPCSDVDLPPQGTYVPERALDRCVHCLIERLYALGYDVTDLAGNWLLTRSVHTRWIAHHPDGCPPTWGKTRWAKAQQWAAPDDRGASPPDAGGIFGHTVAYCQSPKCLTVSEHQAAVDIEQQIEYALRAGMQARLGAFTSAQQLRARIEAGEKPAVFYGGLLHHAIEPLARLAYHAHDLEYPTTFPARWNEFHPLAQAVGHAVLRSVWPAVSAAAALHADVHAHETAGAPPHMRTAAGSQDGSGSSVAEPPACGARYVLVEGLHALNPRSPGGSVTGGTLEACWPAFTGDLIFANPQAHLDGPLLLVLRSTAPVAELLAAGRGLLLSHPPSRWPTAAELPIWISLLRQLPTGPQGANPDEALEVAADIVH